jgi:S1-C subfamily serine protease
LLALLISAGIGTFSVSPAVYSDRAAAHPDRDSRGALSLDRDIYYWRGALLGPTEAAHDKPIGMFVANVAPGSAAAKGELKPGDVIVALDGMPVGTPRFLALAVADHPSGPVVKLRVWRDGSDKRLSVPVAVPDPAGSRHASFGIG